MAGEDEVIRIGAEIDVAPLVSGMQQAVASVEAGTSSMKVAFADTGAASAKMAATLSAQGLSADEVSSALKNAGFSAQEVKAAVTAASEGVKNLGTEEVSATAQTDALAVAIASLGAQLEKINARALSTAGSVRGMGGAMAESRVFAGSLTGSAGMLEGGLARLAFSSSALGPLMQAAFPAFAALALFEVLSMLGDKIVEVTNDLGGYTEAVQKQEKEDIKATEEIIRHATSVSDGQTKIQETFRRTAEITEETLGQRLSKSAEEARFSFSDLFNVIHAGEHIYATVKGATTDYANTALLLTERNRAQIVSENEKIAATDKASIKLAEEQTTANKIGESRIRQLQDEIALTKSLEKAAEDAAAHEIIAKRPESGTVEAQQARLDVQAEYDAKLKTQQRELFVTETQQSIQLEMSKAETERTLGEARVAYQEQLSREMYEAGKISLSQETHDFEVAEYQKYEYERTGLERRRALLEEEQKKTGVDKAPEIEATNAKLEDLAIKHQANLARIDADGAARAKSEAEKVAQAQLEAMQKLEEAQDKFAEGQARRTFNKAETPEQIESATPGLIAAETQQYRDQITVINERIAALQKDDPTKHAAEIIALEGEVTVAETNLKNASITTEQERDDKIKEMRRKLVEDDLAEMNQSLSVSRTIAERDVDSYRTSLDEKRINLRTYLADVTTVYQQEFVAQSQVYERERQAAQQAANQRLLTEEQLQKRLVELNNQELRSFEQMLKEIVNAQRQAAQQQEQSIKQVAQQWASAVTQMANEAITGQKKIGAAFVQLGAKIELDLIDNGIEMVVKKFATAFLQMLASHSQFLASLLGIQTAGDQAQKAAAATTAAGIVQAMAAEAGAAAFATALASAPFPENFAIAEAAMATAIATTESNLGLASAGAFEQGGIVPGQPGNMVPIYAHAQEMVLPASISQGLTSLYSGKDAASVQFAANPAAAANSDITGAKAFENVFGASPEEYAPANAARGVDVGPEGAHEPTNFTVREPGGDLHQAISRAVQQSAGNSSSSSNTTQHFHTQFKNEFHGLGTHEEVQNHVEKVVVPQINKAIRRGKVG